MARPKKSKGLGGKIGQIALIRIFVLLAVAAIGGWLSFAISVAGVNRTKNPQIALMFVENESNALANKADQLYLAQPTKPSQHVAKLARDALRQQAINAKAMRLLGYLADLRGDKQQSLSMVEMAAKLSRREPGAQLWLIEHHAKENDIVKTLKHYDIVMTTKPESQALLYPRLAGAIDDESVRDELLAYMRQDNKWLTGFLYYAIGNNKDLSGVVNLIVEARGFPKNDSAQGLSVSLIGRLVNDKRYDDAQRVYRLMPRAKVARLTNPAFDDSDRDTQFGAMSWQIPDGPNAGGGFVGKKGGGTPLLAIFANSATTQTVASRLLYLQPGNYRFVVQFSQYESGDDGYVKFQMRCPTNDASAPLWIFDVDPQRGVGQLEVPANCPVQFLDIVASGGKGQLGLEATISRVAIMQLAGN